MKNINDKESELSFLIAWCFSVTRNFSRPMENYEFEMLVLESWMLFSMR